MTILIILNKDDKNIEYLFPLYVTTKNKKVYRKMVAALTGRARGMFDQRVKQVHR